MREGWVGGDSPRALSFQEVRIFQKFQRGRESTAIISCRRNLYKLPLFLYKYIYIPYLYNIISQLGLWKQQPMSKKKVIRINVFQKFSVQRQPIPGPGFSLHGPDYSQKKKSRSIRKTWLIGKDRWSPYFSIWGRKRFANKAPVPVWSMYHSNALDMAL